jgi:Raf kinase inhibitor-like YbhB/YbcL family protein
MALVLTSPAFTDAGAIPRQYTCEGGDTSPPLNWSNAPRGTKSFALIVDDPDAPDPRAPRTTWVHWVIQNIPPDVQSLSEGTAQRGLPAGASHGLNDWKRAGYGGPCPPIGRHRYFHKLYALDTVLSGLDHPTKAQLLLALKGHVLAEARLVGTYEKGAH